eukprot:Sdes_comp15894_c0_seq1m5008
MQHFLLKRNPRAKILCEKNASTSSENEKEQQSLPKGWSWKGTVLMFTKGEEMRETVEEKEKKRKIAAFDFDGTLAKTSLFQRGPTRWSFLFGQEKTKNIFQKLSEQESFQLVIFSNQYDIGRTKALARTKMIQEKTGRIEGFLTQLNAQVSVVAFLATEKDEFRKPNAGMWSLCKEHFGGNIDQEHSFFVGNAAGRKSDHGNEDQQFALNAGLKFFTETEFFENQTQEPFIESLLFQQKNISKDEPLPQV